MANRNEINYVLAVISGGDVHEIRTWFERTAENLPLELVFMAYMIGKPPLDDKPVGFIALLKFNSIPQMKAGIKRIHQELKTRDTWSFDFMNASWIDTKLGLLDKGENGDKRMVTTGGRIRFRKSRYFISERLHGEYVELVEDGNTIKVFHAGVLIKTLARKQ